MFARPRFLSLGGPLGSQMADTSESGRALPSADDDEYTYDEPPMRQVRLLTLDDLASEEVMAIVVADETRNLYASMDWSLKYYLTMAWHGFIAVAHEQRDGSTLLLPEMQYRYAHLALDEMHVATVAKKRSGRYRLRLNADLEGVLAGIEASHDSWVLPKYQDLLRILHRRPVRVPVEGGALLHVHSVALIDEASGSLVAGEVGYSIGAVYTSLTGFFDRAQAAAPPPPAQVAPAAPGGPAASSPAAEAAGEAAEASSSSSSRPLHSSAGTVQLVALGALLRRCGFAFWNLGHPPRRATATREARMWYKASLGAHVYKRDRFLEAWRVARAGTPSTPLHEALPAEGMNARALLRGDEVPRPAVGAGAAVVSVA